MPFSLLNHYSITFEIILFAAQLASRLVAGINGGSHYAWRATIADTMQRHKSLLPRPGATPVKRNPQGVIGDPRADRNQLISHK